MARPPWVPAVQSAPKAPPAHWAGVARRWAGDARGTRGDPVREGGVSAFGRRRARAPRGMCRSGRRCRSSCRSTPRSGSALGGSRGSPRSSGPSVPVDRVAADEVRRVDHPVRVGPRLLAVEVEAAEHRRRRGLARRHVVAAVRPAVVGQHQHLARPVELHVLAVVARVRVAQLERALAAQDHRVDGGRRRSRSAPSRSSSGTRSRRCAVSPSK